MYRWLLAAHADDAAPTLVVASRSRVDASRFRARFDLLSPADQALVTWTGPGLNAC